VILNEINGRYYLLKIERGKNEKKNLMVRTELLIGGGFSAGLLWSGTTDHANYTDHANHANHTNYSDNAYYTYYTYYANYTNHSNYSNGASSR